jgi:hypothetical protein
MADPSGKVVTRSRVFAVTHLVTERLPHLRYPELLKSSCCEAANKLGVATLFLSEEVLSVGARTVARQQGRYKRISMDNQLPVIYIARHGETAWTITGQHTGLTDLPLTPQGEKNAKGLGTD